MNAYSVHGCIGTGVRLDSCFRLRVSITYHIFVGTPELILFSLSLSPPSSARCRRMVACTTAQDGRTIFDACSSRSPWAVSAKTTARRRSTKPQF